MFVSARTNIVLIQRSEAAPWSRVLRQAGFHLCRFSDSLLYSSNSAGLAASAVIVSDLGGSTQACMEDLRNVRSVSPSIPVILLVSNSCEESAIAALKAGASDYLKAPVSPEQLLHAILQVSTAISKRREPPAGTKPIPASLPTSDAIRQKLHRRRGRPHHPARLPPKSDGNTTHAATGAEGDTSPAPRAHLPDSFRKAVQDLFPAPAPLYAKTSIEW